MESVNRSDNTVNYAQQQLVQYEGHPQDEPHAAGGLDIVGMIRRRWLLIVLVFSIVCAIGAAAAFKFVKEEFETKAAIEVAPIVPAILYGDSDSERPLPNYDSYKNTQAVIVGSDKVLNRVADDPACRQLQFFAGADDIRMALRAAVDGGAIKIEPQRQTNLIMISMTSPADRYREAERIIDSIVQNYMAVGVQDQTRGEDNKLKILEDERKRLRDQMDKQRETIRQLVDEFGTGELTSRQEMMFEQVASLQRELINVDIRRMAMESKLKMSQASSAQTISEVELLNQKNAIVQTDPTLQALASDIRRYEELVALGQQTMAETNPELGRRQDVLTTLKNRYEQRTEEVRKQVEASFANEQKRSQDNQQADLEYELGQTLEYQNKLKEKIAEHDTKTIAMGQKQLNINDQKEQLEQTKQLYNDYTHSIEVLKIESNRPARISVAFQASSTPAQGKMKKIVGGVLFAAFALSGGLAMLLEMLDKKLHEPKDAARRIGVRIIGTTTNPRDLDRKLIGQQLVDDYQTIRANLGLLDHDQSIKIIVVTSAGQGDGKTTFAINLAASFARSGKKTLIVDGDLRKPDVREKLNLNDHIRGLQDYLFGIDLAKALYKVDSLGIHLLGSDERNSSDAGDLLGQKNTHERIEALRSEFEVIIVDTPPVMAFADALLWSRMADGVVLVSFVGRTSRPEMQQAMERLSHAGARILGTVVNNVRVHQSYRQNGYGYGYGYARGKSKKTDKKIDSLLLLPDNQNTVQS